MSINIEDKNINRLVLPISDSILLPGTTQTIKLNRLKSEELAYVESDEPIVIGLPLREDYERKNLSEESFYNIGVLFRVEEIDKIEATYHMKIEVIDRIKITALNIGEEIILGQYEIEPEIMDLNEFDKNEMLESFKKVIHETSRYFKGSEAFTKMIDDMDEINMVIAYVVPFTRMTREEKYALMEIGSVKERSLKFIEHLLRHKESIKLQVQLAERFSEKANKNYRDSVLREQLKAIQEELNDGTGSNASKRKDYKQMIEEAGMPEDIKAAALEELTKLENQNPSSSDYNIIRNYLDLLVKLPWKKSEPKDIDIEAAREVLESQHYGLEKVKERILQHLAVMKLKKDKKGSILLLVGPPGTGKTSLGKSIAEALGRKYIRLSLGGIRDEAEIRGHRRTYVGAMPGRIIQTMKKAGEKNPVLVLDEIDKLMSGYNGDPSSALLEVLDPEQNDTFTDHYLDLPYDLSEVFFIATANSLDSISRPLLDRMEVIQISSYTSSEKFHIGKNHLIPSVLDEHGLTEEQLIIKEDTLRKVINNYTMEAGVRGLKKQLSAIARVASEKIVSNKVELPCVVEEEALEDILGRQVSRHDKANEDNPAGVVTGLAWTPVGGEILFIEVTDMAGSGHVTLTGKLGDVMQESAKISLSLLKSRLAMSTINFKERDIHIHVPSGAVPKDGPSAGIALFTALASLVTGIKVDSKLAMTGEITLRGVVLPIGGLKEKLLAAQRAGIKKALIPKDNIIDLKDVPEEVKNQITIIPVDTIEDVLRETLGISMPREEKLFNEISWLQREESLV